MRRRASSTSAAPSMPLALISAIQFSVVCRAASCQRAVSAGSRVMRVLPAGSAAARRSEEHTSERQSLMGRAYAVFRVKKKTIVRRLLIEQQMLVDDKHRPIIDTTIITIQVKSPTTP